MKRAIRKPHLWRALFLWAIFWPVAWIIPYPYLFFLVNALTVAVAIGILIAYAPGIRKTLGDDHMSGAHMLVLGIAVSWFATAVRHVWNWLWRYMGQPDWMLNHPFVAFLVYVAFTGGVLHLTAQDVIDGQIPKRNWLRLGIVVAIGVAICLIVVLFFEDAQGLAAAPQGWLDRQ